MASTLTGYVEDLVQVREVRGLDECRNSGTRDSYFHEKEKKSPGVPDREWRLQDTQAHSEAYTDLLASLHLKTPNNFPGEMSEHEVHHARIRFGQCQKKGPAFPFAINQT